MARTSTRPSAFVRWLTAIAVAFGLMATSIVIAPAAQAGPICNASAGWVCGKLYNNGSVGIGIIGSWGQSYSKILWPGENSTKYFSDTDGFYVGPGYCADLKRYAPRGVVIRHTYGPGNHKINDSEQWYISARRC